MHTTLGKSSFKYKAQTKARAAAWIFCIGIFLFLLAVRPAALSAEELPFSGLSSSEGERLRSGEPVFTVLDSHEDMRLQPGDAQSRELYEKVKDVKPNFLAEILMVIPVDEETDHLDYIRSSLSDIREFDTIPYYSQRHEKHFPLFEDSEIVSRSSPSSAEDVIVARHLMKPFKEHTSRYTLTKEDNTFLFVGENTSAIKYNRFTAVSEGEMLNLLWIEDRGETLVVYGLGGAKAFTFFGLFGGRLDDAFIGRVDAFFHWYYDEHIKEMMIK